MDIWGNITPENKKGIEELLINYTPIEKKIKPVRCIKEWGQKYYKKNKSKIQKYQQEYYQKNIIKKRLYNKYIYQQNKVKNSMIKL